ncbi:MULTISPECIES: sensor histidine kinase [Streptomyces]|uniref:histidine kinase n=1 Tax=Streptomyces clavifer TaxID=68188 RepID=A0ABS4V3Y6_9ACTN|nr:MULTISPECIES: sensor histidine kinase [Streptomyces]MBP2358618.1 two-component system CitB family sensor kinase [Streptomyces clavifer]MDX2746955.1 sensor histidine kinase [Streptomyces sp. NRRL_B-2557]MDX3060831.1 sensor histidine kinase [Streptomyces sp. ND04-05B]RPK82457.1 Sensor histidine kinase DcuS [Streptomyces sp. ADI97-07]GHB22587.1 histidine kinase [Streptomyces clavifer]
MSAPPTVLRAPHRFGWPKRVFSQVLLMQLAIITGVTVLVTGLFLAPLSAQLDDQAMRRALAIAQSTAAQQQIAVSLLTTEPAPGGPVQAAAERIRRSTGAEYVVIMDKRGVRWSHTDADRIGEVVSTDPSTALAGRAVMEIDNGTLGRSARGKVPLRDDSDRIVGAVSVGIAYDSVRARLLAAIPGLLAYAGGALAVGALAAYLISRRLQRQTHDLAFSDISALLTEREAMLHSIREGVVALDRTGRIRLLNDEAQRLLGLGPDAAGRPLDEALGAGRTAEVLAGRVVGDDLVAVSGNRVLLVNRMPTDDGGAVATLRDRTELEYLGRELDSTRGLIDALRAQDHEHANRLHTLLGLLELEMHEDAMEFVTEVVGVHRATAEQVTEKVHDPLLAALLVGKATVAAERGVSLRVAPGTLLPDRLVDPRGLVTVVGNLVDNALDAAAGSVDARIEVGLRAEGRTVVLRVHDSGPGVPSGSRESIFMEGWSTKDLPAHGKRGLGLPLVRRLAERQGGSASVSDSPDGGAVFTVVLPEALGEPDPGGDPSARVRPAKTGDAP